MPQRYFIVACAAFATFLNLAASGNAAPKTYREVAAEELQKLGVALYDESSRPIEGEKSIWRIYWHDIPDHLHRPAKETQRILALIPLFTEVTRLDIYWVPITDRDLTFLRRLTNLRHLELQHTEIAGPGLINIDSLTELRQIDLCESPIADAGLEHIAKLWRLRQIDLELTKVSDGGVDRLAAALPTAWIKSPKCPTFDKPYEARWGEVGKGLQLGVGLGARYWANQFYVRNATSSTLEVCTHDLPPQGVKVWIADPATKTKKSYEVLCMHNASGVGPLRRDVHRLNAGGTIATEFAGCTFATWYAAFDVLPRELLDRDVLDMEFEISLRQLPLGKGRIIKLRSPVVSVDMKHAREVIAEEKAREEHARSKQP